MSDRTPNLPKKTSKHDISSSAGKRVISAFLAAVLLVSVLLTGCQSKTAQGQNESFEKFTEAVFCQEVSSNTVSLHYTLKNPSEYGIENAPVTFGSFAADKKVRSAATENMQASLSEFSYEKLSRENQLTYDVLDYYLNLSMEENEYLLYEEPLSLVSGIQTQLPVLLSEYQFYNEEDVQEYLQLMQTTPEYFDSLIQFEQKKSEAGLFMADYAADTVIEQCEAFMGMNESNYLISTFVDRIQQMEELSEKEQSNYIQKNALMLQSYILPAYTKLVNAVRDLKGTGTNEEGLCNLPKGKDYYSLTVRAATGSEKTVEELEEMTKQQIIEDLEAMENVLGITAEQAKETAAVSQSEPSEILRGLESGIGTAFPELSDTQVEVKYVPEAMEEHLSPAFYMIPALDNTEENVIYVNKAQMGNNLTLYTTLAHEGYPGHLYQTVYYARTNPDPLRSIFNFGGYVEGWATYAEMGSYYLNSELTKEQATLLQKNNSIILALYALTDMGIHYDGWSRIDTAAFFKNYGITDVDVINQIYELIIGSPGNYLKYYIGYVEFLELKKEWLAEKGEDFSQKEFHKAVLDVGPAPFEIVEKYMWE